MAAVLVATDGSRKLLWLVSLLDGGAAMHPVLFPARARTVRSTAAVCILLEVYADSE